MTESVETEVYLKQKFLCSISFIHQTACLVFAYLIKSLGVIFSQLTHYQFKLVIQYTDETSQ